jgi:hypothetical protein
MKSTVTTVPVLMLAGLPTVDDPVDLVGNPLVVKPGNAAYQTMISTGTASQGSKPGVVVPGICGPNVTSGWSPGGLPVIIKASSVATAPILTTNTTTLLPGVPVSSGFNYGPTTFSKPVPGRQHVPDW